MPLSWTRQPLRFFQHLLREADAATLSIPALVAEIKSVGAEACIVMGGGFSAWYPTELESQTVNPLMRGDFLGDFLMAAKAENLRVIVRMDISKGRAGTEQRHPDWCVRAAGGAPALLWAMPQMCPTGPFWQREVFLILDELLSRYPALDGFFFNYLHVPRCYCHRCATAVQEAAGAAVPPPGMRSVAYETWRQTYLADYMTRIRSHVHARNPGAALIPYHHVHDGWDIRRMAEISDIISSQVSNPVIPNPVDPQPMWNLWATEQALLARALKPEAAPLLIQTTSEVFASRQSSMPGARLVANLAQVAAQGASTAPAVNGFLDQAEARFVPALERFGAYQQRAAHWYRGLTNPARIAVIRSEESRLWGPDAGSQAGAEGGHVHELRGIAEALGDLRYPFAMLVAGALTDRSLRAFDLIVLPGAHCLSDEDAQLLDVYVSQGGTLLVTADSASCDAAGERRGTAASRVLPVPATAEAMTGGYFALSDAGLRAALGGGPYMPAMGAFWPQDGVEGDLRKVGPFINNAPEFTVVEGDGTCPALIRQTHGKGFAIWLGFRPGAIYHQFALPAIRQLLGHLIASRMGHAPVRGSMPLAVEVCLATHPEGQVLHLINRAAQPGKPQTDLSPLAGFEAEVRGSANRVLCLSSGEDVAFYRQDGWVGFRVNRLDDFAAFALIGDRPSTNDKPERQWRASGD